MGIYDAFIFGKIIDARYPALPFKFPLLPSKHKTTSFIFTYRIDAYLNGSQKSANLPISLSTAVQTTSRV